MTQPDPFDIDLDAERAARAAEYEGKGNGAPIRLGGQVLATLPPELPLDVLAPLRNLDADITLMVRTAMQAARSRDAETQMNNAAIVIDLLAANPGLPLALIDVVKEMAVALVGEDGYQALVAARLSVPDVASIAKRVTALYGVTLGEASAPSGSPEGSSGATSNGTSGTTSDLTPEVSGSDPATPALSASASS